MATGVLFGVDWGNPWLTALVLVAFSAVSAGAAMVLGSLIDNEGAASGGSASASAWSWPVSVAGWSLSSCSATRCAPCRS